MSPFIYSSKQELKFSIQHLTVFTNNPPCKSKWAGSIALAAAGLFLQNQFSVL